MQFLKDNKFFNFYRILQRAFGPYKLRMIILVILGFLNGLFEAIGISILIPIFSFVIKGQERGNDFISKNIEGFFSYIHLAFTLKYLIVFVTILLLTKIIILFLVNYISAKIAADYEIKTRNNLFRATFTAGWSYLSKQKMGYLDQLLTNDVRYASQLLIYISTIALSLSMFVVYTIVAINISLVVTFSAFIVGLFIFLVFRGFYQKSKIISRKLEGLYKLLAHHANETIIGAKTIKSLAVEESVIKKGQFSFSELKKLNISSALIRVFTSVLIQPIGLIFAIGVFIFLYKWSVFNFASFIVIIYAINKIFSQIESGQTHIHCILGLSPYLMNVLRYQDIMKANEESLINGKKFKFEQRLQFENICFSYNGKKNELENINFFIKKGEFVGLIGRSGAGKTTLVDLLLRLLPPQRGQILIDGNDIQETNLREWRTNIGYVSQDSFLINDTVENNIKFYNDTIKHEEVVAAAKMANIYDFVNELPDKFLTQVGERGLSLSGGQRQRIALARVLVRKPQILILDEATSSLDNESEMLIQKAIENFKGQFTVIIIAHRLSTVKNTDRLIVLDGGRIVEEGAPDNLLKNTDSYFYKSLHLR